MLQATLVSDLLDPISADQSAGVDLRWTPEWDRIKEARRADDPLEPGKWAKKERKTADWRLTQELATTMLRDRSKDLQLALWLTEANIKLQGFPGLRDGLRITRELMQRYWEQGLYPKMEEGPEDRAGPLEWLNDKLVDSIKAIAITAQADKGQRKYSFIDLLDARRVGFEASCRSADGDIDANKKRNYDQALADGNISMEMFQGAVRETKRDDYEELSSDFLQAYEEFIALDKVVDEKFGDAAPNLSACRRALGEIKHAISDILDEIRLAQPDASTPPKVRTISETTDLEDRDPKVSGGPLLFRFPVSPSTLQDSQPASGASWREAEVLIRSGDVERGSPT